MTEEPLEEPFEDPWQGVVEERREELLAPPVLALVAFVTSVLSVAGLGLLNGSTYVSPLITNQLQPTRMLLGTVLGALLALVPVLLGWRVAARTLDDDPPWVATVARAAVLLGLGGLVLRLVVAVLQASQGDQAGFSRL